MIPSASGGTGTLRRGGWRVRPRDGSSSRIGSLRNAKKRHDADSLATRALSDMCETFSMCDAYAGQRSFGSKEACRTSWVVVRLGPGGRASSSRPHLEATSATSSSGGDSKRLLRAGQTERSPRGTRCPGRIPHAREHPSPTRLREALAHPRGTQRHPVRPHTAFSTRRTAVIEAQGP